MSQSKILLYLHESGGDNNFLIHLASKHVPVCHTTSFLYFTLRHTTSLVRISRTELRTRTQHLTSRIFTPSTGMTRIAMATVGLAGTMYIRGGVRVTAGRTVTDRPMIGRYTYCVASTGTWWREKNKKYITIILYFTHSEDFKKIPTLHTASCVLHLYLRPSYK